MNKPFKTMIANTVFYEAMKHIEMNLSDIIIVDEHDSGEFQIENFNINLQVSIARQAAITSALEKAAMVEIEYLKIKER